MVAEGSLESSIGTTMTEGWEAMGANDSALIGKQSPFALAPSR